jgi:hypothetical protein
MKRSTIRAVIQNKIDKWLSSIKDETLAKELESHIIVTGGCIASMFLNEKVNDYDIYIDDYAILKRLAEYYVEEFNTNNTLMHSYTKDYKPIVQEIERANIRDEFEKRIIIVMKSSGVAGEEQAQQDYQYFEHTSETSADQFLMGDSTFLDSGVMVESMLEDIVETVENVNEELKKSTRKYRPIFMTDNAITLSDKVQIIIRFYGMPEEIHKNFDYLHATCWYHSKTRELVTPDGALESMLTKQLKYTGSLYPIASVFRMRKFIKRGWNISAGQILKMLSQLEKVDFTEINSLKEQLMGVDVAYMDQLITALSSTTERIDASYIAKLVDTIFED